MLAGKSMHLIESIGKVRWWACTHGDFCLMKKVLASSLSDFILQPWHSCEIKSGSGLGTRLPWCMDCLCVVLDCKLAVPVTPARLLNPGIGI